MSKLPYSGNLDSEIPPEIRILVYKKAICQIKRNTYTKYGLQSACLCLLLPCILWNLKSYKDYGPNQYNWENTNNAFPEFTNKEIDSITSIPINLSAESTIVKSRKKRDKKRLEILENAIIKVQKIINK